MPSARRLKPFQRLQYRFAAHLRDPKRQPVPRGIEPRRMKIYRELFYNNIEGFLAAAFPVLRRITPDRRWHAMARDFLARHQSHEPLFHRVAEEFLKYLEHERGKVRGDPAFLRELAHYEWVELALSVSELELAPALADPSGDLLAGIPVMSPLARLQSYSFPVQRIGPDFLPAKPVPQPVHIVVWRNREDEVKFMEANAVTARLLQLIGGRRRTGRQLLQRIARELNHPEPGAVVADGAGLLQGLLQRGIILGTRRTRVVTMATR